LRPVRDRGHDHDKECADHDDDDDRMIIMVVAVTGAG
jgi:hypothetical protein